MNTPKTNELLARISGKDTEKVVEAPYPAATAYANQHHAQWSAPHSPEGGDAGTRLPIEQAGPINKAASLQRLRRALPFGLDAERARLKTVMSFEPEDLSQYAKNQHDRESVREVFQELQRTGRSDTPFGRLVKQRHDEVVAPYDNAVMGNEGLSHAKKVEQAAFDDKLTQQQFDRTLGATALVGGGGLMAIEGAKAPQMSHPSPARRMRTYKHAFLGGLAAGAGRAALGGSLSLGKLGLKGAIAGGKAGLKGGKGLMRAHKGFLDKGGIGGLARRGAQKVQSHGVGQNSRVLNALSKPKGKTNKFERAGEVGFHGDTLRTDYRNFGKV